MQRVIDFYKRMQFKFFKDGVAVFCIVCSGFFKIVCGNGLVKSGSYDFALFVDEWTGIGFSYDKC